METGFDGVREMRSIFWGSQCRQAASRREFLRIGGLSALGLGLGDLFRLQRLKAQETNFQETRNAPRAKSCILIWLDGGPSHLETFDPKPDAPIEVRGPLQSIATSVPGVRFTECLPKTAALAHQLAIIRSMTSPLGRRARSPARRVCGHRRLPHPGFISKWVATP